MLGPLIQQLDCAAYAALQGLCSVEANSEYSCASMKTEGKRYIGKAGGTWGMVSIVFLIL